MSEPAERDGIVKGSSDLVQPSRHFGQKIRDGVVALSLANFCFVSSWFYALFDADRSYFNKMPVGRPTLEAFAVNILWFALLAWLVICARRRFQSRWLRHATGVVFLVLLLIPADFIRVAVFHLPAAQVFEFVKQPVPCIGLLALAGLVAWNLGRAVQVAAVGVGVMSPLAFFTLGKILLLYFGVLHLAQNTQPAVLPPPGPVRPGQPRVIWILFDGMDYRLSFEQRPVGLQLREFDRVRRESLYVTNAYPPGDATDISMPGLICGQRVSALSIANPSDLTLTLPDTGEIRNWSRLPSVFSRARELGVNTALVGWYHPYDRVLKDSLNYCAWYPMPLFEPGRASTFGAAMRRQISCIVSTLHNRELYIELCRDSLKESLALVTNATYGLVLLHLPPPHKPGIYLPERDQFTVKLRPIVSGYFDNLALADRWLGQLRGAMEGCGQWDKTWVILSADHSWRESPLYDGRRDLRVPFIVKPPVAGEGMAPSVRINTVLTDDLIQSVLRGEITDERQAAAWLERHGSQLKTVSGLRED